LNQHIKLKHRECYLQALQSGGLYKLRKQLTKKQIDDSSSLNGDKSPNSSEESQHSKTTIKAE
jgi:hypothetical protein